MKTRLTDKAGGDRARSVCRSSFIYKVVTDMITKNATNIGRVSTLFTANILLAQPRWKSSAFAFAASIMLVLRLMSWLCHEAVLALLDMTELQVGRAVEGMPKTEKHIFPCLTTMILHIFLSFLREKSTFFYFILTLLYQSRKHTRYRIIFLHLFAARCDA